MSTRERFWAKVDKSGGPDTCWLWTAGRCGYGRFHVNRKPIGAHRYAWQDANGVGVPAGLFVCHRCDNILCVNPAHLFTGTALDNVQDMISKGRRSTSTHGNYQRGDAHFLRRHPELVIRGDGHWSRKNPESVIRGDAHYARCRAGGVTPADIAKRIGVTSQTVRNWIKRGIVPATRGEYSYTFDAQAIDAWVACYTARKSKRFSKSEAA